MATKQLAVSLLSAVMVLSGCSQPVEVSEARITSMENTVVLASADKVLSKMQFDIDKLDVEHGYLRTRPLPAAQFFEFWRDDNATGKDALEANMHTIRRTVEVRQADTVGFEVAVLTERLSVSNTNISGKPQISEKFSDTRARGTKRKIDIDPEQMEWIKLGRDSELEKIITRAINKEIIHLESEKG